MRIIISILMLIGSFLSLSAQESTYESRRDWFVGRYEGFYCIGDTTDALWSNIEFEILYDTDTTVRTTFSPEGNIYPYDYDICKDSIIGHYNDYPTDICFASNNDGGILYQDSTLVFWYTCAPAYGCILPNGIFSEAKWSKAMQMALEK